MSLVESTVENNKGRDGTGVWLKNSQLQLNSTVIRRNQAFNKGAGMYLSATKLDAFNVSILDNKGDFGGGLYAIDSHIHLNQSWVESNTATVQGGGVYISSGNFSALDTWVKGNRAYAGAGYMLYEVSFASEGGGIVNNTGSFGAGLASRENAKLQLRRTLIHNNFAESDGGAMHITNSIVLISANCTFSNNTAALGGAFWLQKSQLEAEDMMVSGNTANRNGGGVYTQSSEVGLTAVTVQHNEAGSDGGGMWVNEGSVRGTDLHISGNQARRGGGAFSSSRSNTELRMAGGRVHGNTAETGGGGVCAGPAAPTASQHLHHSQQRAAIRRGLVCANCLWGGRGQQLECFARLVPEPQRRARRGWWRAAHSRYTPMHGPHAVRRVWF